MNQSVHYQNHQINFYTEGNGEIIIFLHGWPTNSRLWKSQVETLKTNYKVVTLDWLGFGISDKPSDYKYTFSKKKEILDIVLKNVMKNNEKATIVAHDIGGPPAILWASENSHKVERLILLNTILYPFSTTLDKISHLFFEIPGVREILVSNFGLRTLLKVFSKSKGDKINLRIKEIIHWHKNQRSSIKLKTILEPLKTGKKKEFLSLDRKFKALPVTKYLIIAKGDPLCYAHMKKLKDDAPDIPSHYINNCGHYIPVDKPNELNKILVEILEKDKSKIEN